MSKRGDGAMVLYCLIRQAADASTPERFLLIEKQGHPAFPPTKFRPGEDLYSAIVRPMERAHPTVRLAVRAARLHPHCCHRRRRCLGGRTLRSRERSANARVSHRSL